MFRLLLLSITITFGSLTLLGQTANDTLTVSKNLDEITVLQRRSPAYINIQGNQLIIDVAQIKTMPKFLGTTDLMRYIHSLAGVQTNNETSTGLYVQGCDDYQTLIAINDAPIYYPNHLLGLFSTFITSHFKALVMEQAEHQGTMPNRIGGLVSLSTHDTQPVRFGLEGNAGLTNSELTLTIPCGKKNALWISGRCSYINLLYKKLLRTDDMDVQYNFMDYNITYASQLTPKDNLTITGFYSRDKLNLSANNMAALLPWQNIMGNIRYTHSFSDGQLQTTTYYSSFNNSLEGKVTPISAHTDSYWASMGVKNKMTYSFSPSMLLSGTLNYDHYVSRPIQFEMAGIQFLEYKSSTSLQHGDEVFLGVNWQHKPISWLSYDIGIASSLYIFQHDVSCVVDPRATLRFHPTNEHTISLHYGIYHQPFHKTGLTEGGLPTDFFFLANKHFPSERAHAINLRYTGAFYGDKYALQVEAYFKQMNNVVESTGTVFQLLNKTFSYNNTVIVGKGRNYGVNVMVQRKKGYVTGYISYTLGWAKRQFPQLEGSYDYIYNASHERMHDLKIVLNSQVAKRWNIGLMFVLASGNAYTKPLEAYVFNGKMMCSYSRYNAEHLPLYHRLDLTCSYDIIKKNGHDFGISISLFNVYAHKNTQFIVYRDDLSAINGTIISTIIPSLSLYGTF